MMKPLLACLSFTGAAMLCAGAPAAPDLAHDLWPAFWITAALAPAHDYGVYHFRKHFTLAERPATFRIHVSADNRYRLFVNGVSVSVGPARGDLMHWRYETVDLAPQLHAGDNVLAAEVWNAGLGGDRPMGQMTLQTGFIVQGLDAAAGVVDTTAEGWKAVKDEAYAALPPDRAVLQTYLVAGAGDDVDGARYPWGWETAGFDDRAWPAAQALMRGREHGVSTDVDWWLVPRTIPQPEETPQRFASVRRSEGVTPGAGFVAGREPLTIPAHDRATFLLDQSEETTAYPELLVSGGRGSAVTLTYAEALIDARRAKGDRNEIEGKRLIGVSDRFRPDGGVHRRFAPLWYRAFRYVEVAVETGDEPLTIDDLRSTFTAYPFERKASFASDDPELTRIWDVGWHTARLCAFETYMDCPYYEQLQYVGDTRIQALISLQVSGDDRLMRKAIDLFDQSRIAEGLTQSRYPSERPQIINTFSLFWIEMVHDYWMHRDDAAFVRERLVGISAVIDWFSRHVDARTGMLGPLPYWTFVDWPDAWAWSDTRGSGGEPAGAHTGGSSIVTLQFATTLQDAAEFFDAYGRHAEAAAYRAQAEQLKRATLARCWDADRRLVADTPERKEFSQHANIMAVLAGALPEDRARELIVRVAGDANLTPATQYFQFYLLRAMKAAGEGDRYVSQLGPWRAMLAKGLTTFAERPDPTRSDCHAWSASPTYELLATVCGVEPGSPGFKTVRIEPHLGLLQHVSGVVPHPAGEIRVDFRREGARLTGTITLPEGVTGEFIQAGQTLSLHAGRQDVAG